MLTQTEVKVITTYVCEHCKTPYKTETAARKCEKQCSCSHGHTLLGYRSDCSYHAYWCKDCDKIPGKPI